MTKKIGLVLGTGAARGLAHIGVLEVLAQLGIKIDLVVGTSMGAMIGGALAAGLNAQDLRKIACETNWLKVAQILFPRRLQRDALLDGERVEEFLLALLGNTPIEQLPIPFACVATDVWTGEEIVLNTGDLARAIRASISFPFLFTAVEMGGRLLVDGGVVNPLPVDVARKMGARKIIAVNTMPPIDRHSRMMNSGKISRRWPWKHTANSDSLLKRLKKLFGEQDEEQEIINRPGIRQQMIQIGTIMEHQIMSLRLKESQPDVFIQPDVATVQFFDFTRPREIIQKGAQATLALKDQLLTLLEGD